MPKTGVVVWNHAMYVRSLPRGVKLKPGRNTVAATDWEVLKKHSRVKSLLAAGQEAGISVADLRNDIADKIKAGANVGIVNDLPVVEAVAYVYEEEDPAKLKELLTKVKYPQVAVAIQHRMKELDTRGSKKPTVTATKKKDEK